MIKLFIIDLNYSNGYLTGNAYKLWQGGMTVYKAAKLTGVPRQTPRDRTCGHVDPYKCKSGPDTVS